MTMQTLEEMLASRARTVVLERYEQFRQDIRAALQRLDNNSELYMGYAPTCSGRAKLFLAGLEDLAERDMALDVLTDREVVRMRQELLDAVGRVDEILGRQP